MKLVGTSKDYPSVSMYNEGTHQVWEFEESVCDARGFSKEGHMTFHRFDRNGKKWSAIYVDKNLIWDCYREEEDNMLKSLFRFGSDENEFNSTKDF